MIKIARVLCIIFMMTTHIWPGSDRILQAKVGPGLHFFYIVVVDSLGRASVPLLSMISGLLLAFSFQQKSSLTLFRSKLKTLIVPMIAWSIPMILIMFVERKITGQPQIYPAFTLDWINRLFAITSSPANGPLHFLRDIFLMSLYGLLILNVWRYNRALALCIALGVVLLEQIPGGFLLFRNQIATFYVFGLVMASLGKAEWKPSWWLIAVLVATYATSRSMGLLEISPGNHFQMRIAQHVPRLAMSFLIWRTSWELSARRNIIRNIVSKIEPHIFTIFCLHPIVVKFVSGTVRLTGWHESAIYYPAIFIGQIVFCVLAGIVVSRLLAPLPWLRGKIG